MRCSRKHAAHDAVLHHPCREPLPQQLEHPPVRDASADERHQLVVVDASEVVADVGVEHVIAPASAALSQRLERHRRTLLRPEAVRARKEIRLEDRLQHELRRHLHHSVSHRRDAQRPLLAVGLRNVPTQHRCRSIRACAQRRLDRFERRLIAAAKKKHADIMAEIATARGSLYPFGKHQERALNFVPLLARYGPSLRDDMLAEAERHAARIVGASAVAEARPEEVSVRGQS